MSSFAVSGITSSNVPEVAATVRTAPVQAQAAASSMPEDTVKLSAAAQAKLLYKQGESVSSIASSLGTSVSAVDSYLGITVAIPVATASVAHAAPAAATASAATSKAAKVAVKG